MLILKKRVRECGGGGGEGGEGVGCHSLCLVDLSFDWCTLRHRVVYTSTYCGVHFDIVCSPHVVFLSEGRRKMLEKYSKRLPRLSSLCMYTSFQI